MTEQKAQQNRDALTEPFVQKNVCPRCANGRPSCADKRPDGTHYAHGDTCATYQWATDVCEDCKPFLEADAAASTGEQRG